MSQEEQKKDQEQIQSENQNTSQNKSQENNSKQTNSQIQSAAQQNSQNFNIDDYLEDDGFFISVIVTDPIVKDSSVSKYVQYQLKGEDKIGTFDVFRRYSDFYALRSVLVSRWPGLYIPPIPPKKASGNFDTEFILERKYQFEKFLEEISKLKHIWYADEFQKFLRTNNPDIEKELSTLKKMYYEDVIMRYQNVFKKLSGKVLDSELELKINAFNLFLKRIKDQLEKYRQMVKSMSQARTLYNVEFDKFMTFLMPQYEFTCLKEYVGNIVEGKYVFAEQNEPKLHQILNEIKALMNQDKYQELNMKLKLEINEIDAMIESIETLEWYQTLRKQEQQKVQEHQNQLAKAQQGKTSKFKKLFSSKSDDQRAQEETLKVDMHQGILDKIEQVIDLIKVLIGYIEIDKFKQNKVNQYYETIKSIASYEYEFSKKKAEIWEYVIQNENIGEEPQQQEENEE